MRARIGHLEPKGGASLRKLMHSAWFTHAAVAVLACAISLIALGAAIASIDHTSSVSLQREKRRLELHIQSLMRRNEDLQTALLQHASRNAPAALSVFEAKETAVEVQAAAPAQPPAPAPAPAVAEAASMPKAVASERRAPTIERPSAKAAKAPSPPVEPSAQAVTAAPAEMRQTVTSAASGMPSSADTALAESAPAEVASQPAMQVVTADQIERSKRNPIEMVRAANLAKLGIERFDAQAVRMKSGVEVRVGQRFVSGETLIAADAGDRKIVTDKRTILILD